MISLNQDGMIVEACYTQATDASGNYKERANSIRLLISPFIFTEGTGHFAEQIIIDSKTVDTNPKLQNRECQRVQFDLTPHLEQIYGETYTGTAKDANGVRIDYFNVKVSVKSQHLQQMANYSRIQTSCPRSWWCGANDGHNVEKKKQTDATPDQKDRCSGQYFSLFETVSESNLKMKDNKPLVNIMVQASGVISETTVIPIAL